MWQLKCFDRDGQIILLPLFHAVVAIGRHPENNIILSDPDVSRRHAKIYVDPGSIIIEDLSSTNGVFINNFRINNPTNLSVGDQIIIGSNQFFVASEPDNENDLPSKLALSPEEFEATLSRYYTFETDLPIPPSMEFSSSIEETEYITKETLLRRIYKKVMDVDRYPRIEVIHLGMVMRCHLITIPEFIIGKSADCHLRLDHADVSLHHSMIRTTPRGIYLFDLESASGTYVNGNRIHSIVDLSHGDKITVGSFKMKYINTRKDDTSQSKYANMIYKIEST